MTKKTSLLDSFMRVWARARPARPYLWLAPHLAVLVLFFSSGQTRVVTDLYSILPATAESPGLAKAEAVMSAQNNSGLFILVGHEDFGRARAVALELAETLAAHPDAERVLCEIGGAPLESVRDYLFAYRYFVQDDATVRAIEENPAGFAADALSTAYMPFTLSSLASLDVDPFLLSETGAARLAESAIRSGTSLAPRDGVLSAGKDGVQYVLVSAKARAAGGSVKADGHLVSAVYSAQDRLRSGNPGISFYDSGVPFHSFESARNAQREVSLIATVSLALACALLVAVFRSVAPLVLTVGAVAAGSAVAFSATHLAFGEVHVLTLAFGTSLIGVSIDYALHFFVTGASRKTSRADAGAEVLRHVLAGVFLGLVTTLASYSVLAAAPFPLLRQMALFSIVGLLSVFSSVVLVFPRFVRESPPRHGLPTGLARAVLRALDRVMAVPRRVRLAVLACVALAAVPGLLSLRFDNDIRGLYTMSPHLLESEKMARSVLDHGSTGWYFLLEADDPESLLVKEEALSALLDEEVSAGRLGSYLGTSRYLPSRERQIRSWKAIGRNLMPLAETQLEALGFPAGSGARAERDWRDAESRFLTPSLFFAHPASDLVGSFWIGEVDGRHYSAVLPLHASDAGVFSRIAKGMEGVHFIDKTADISKALSRLSLSRLVLLVAAYCVIVLILSFRYSLPFALVISRGPLAAIILTAAVLGYAGHPLNLFSVMGFVLVVGIGIDYSIFLSEPGTDREATFLAVILCMLTTVCSFGALSLSSFAPVSTFGFTLLVGIVFSFFVAPLNVAGRETAGRKTAARGKEAE